MATTYDRARPRSGTSLRAEALLARYPNLSEQELAELINLFSRLTMVDQAVMAADERVAEKLVEFHRRHGEDLSVLTGERTRLLVWAAMAAALILWLIIS
jgi:hypothetical protein